jgi:hypothetical protein
MSARPRKYLPGEVQASQITHCCHTKIGTITFSQYSMYAPCYCSSLSLIAQYSVWHVVHIVHSTDRLFLQYYSIKYSLHVTLVQFWQLSHQLLRFIKCIWQMAACTYLPQTCVTQMSPCSLIVKQNSL